MRLFNRRAKRRQRLEQLLTRPLVLEEGRAPRLLANLLYLASGFVVVCIIWASVTEIRELTIAPGQVKPAGSEKLVQHLEGGVVAEILSSEGEVVEQGAAMVRLQPVAASSDLGQFIIRSAALTLKKERLDAQLQGRKPDFGETGRHYPALAHDQREVMRTMAHELERKRETLAARIEQRQTELKSFGEQAESLQRQLAIQREQLEIREKLLKDGLVAKTRYLETRKLYEKTHADLIAMQGQARASREALAEARSALRELDSEHRKRLTDERAKAAAELAELAEAIAKHKDRVARLIVRAPVTGVVQEIVPKSVGSVVKPGDVVARIVPLNQELVAEVQIRPDDIGHVKVGDAAEVKVTTYDPARFGAIKGAVRRISATTFQTDQGEPFYRGIIALQKNHVGGADGGHLVLPGMVVRAEIVSGAKSLARYLLKPVYRSFDAAFIER